MDSKKIQMPREVHIGPHVLDQIGEICKNLRLFDEALIVSGYHTFDVAGKQTIEAMESSDFGVDVIKVKDASMESVQEVQDRIANASVVLGVGGGKIIDVAKLASTNAHSYFLSVPTTASHDGIASPMASIKNDGGSVSKSANSPMAVVADTGIINTSPFRLIASGCADIVSNYTAIKDWKLAFRLKNETYSESAAALSEMTAKLIIRSSDCIKEGLEESARIVVKSLFSSGMAISIAGSSRPASGSEHLFSHALDRIAKKPALHGEQCGVGTIMMMHLHGGDWKSIQSILKTIGAPTNAAELGLDDDEIIDALTMAHTIRPERYTILGDNGLTREAAIKLAKKTEVI
ncbi:MAG: NAD(P)-dependent glycerol-1-phosphate dehydrogenase [Methanobrevibacter sp.]|nr:NAD(P)-dependent glycerol-1-phosphate dehydrogenase [Methanobrevibacter sp.]